jgi:hypothetical protein
LDSIPELIDTDKWRGAGNTCSRLTSQSFV